MDNIANQKNQNVQEMDFGTENILLVSVLQKHFMLQLQLIISFLSIFSATSMARRNKVCIGA